MTLFRRAVEIDARHADLGLGLTDASVMALAERHDLPILTFDFEHFRAAPPPDGYWRLVVDEARYADATA
jgi:predicted nucleic acid-binding protein